MGAPAIAATMQDMHRLIALACVAVAVCAAVAVGVTAIGRDASFVDRAHAAMTAPGLFHVVEESSLDAPPAVFKHAPFKDLEPRRARTEAWYDRGDNASHFIVSVHRNGGWVRRTTKPRSRTASR